MTNKNICCKERSLHNVIRYCLAAIHYTHAGWWQRVIRFQRDSWSSHDGHNEKQTLSLYTAFRFIWFVVSGGKISRNTSRQCSGIVNKINGYQRLMWWISFDELFQPSWPWRLKRDYSDVRQKKELFTVGVRDLSHALIIFMMPLFYDIVINEIRWSKTLTIILLNY